MQAALAISQDALLEAGYYYPLPEHIRDKAMRGETTSGNVKPDGLADFLATQECPPDAALLVSNEGQFQRFSSGEAIEHLLKRFPASEASVLLMVRDPLENAASSYLQAVQKRQISGDFESVLMKFTRPLHVARVIRNCRQAGIAIEVRNYSREKKDLLGVLARWIGVEALKRPVQSQVNRSLTAAEAEVQRRLNGTATDAKVLSLGDRLSRELPNVSPDKPKVSSEVIARFFQRVQPQVDEVHDLLGHEIYQQEDPAPFTCYGTPRYYLEPDQIDLITGVLMAGQRRNGDL